MGQKAPGKAHRKGLTLLQVADRFGNESSATARGDGWTTSSWNGCGGV